MQSSPQTASPDLTPGSAGPSTFSPAFHLPRSSELPPILRRPATLARNESSSAFSTGAVPELGGIPSWSTAASDSAEGILYTKERFPGDITYLGPPYRNEPIEVEANDKVKVLEEINDHVARVLVLRTGATGILPLWNLEDPLFKIARINMEMNERLLSTRGPARALIIPRGRKTIRTHSPDDGSSSDSSSSSDESSDSDIRSPPLTPEATHEPLFRKVEFVDGLQKTIFRYILPEEPDDSDNDDAEDSEQWWEGWVENAEEDEGNGAAVTKTSSPHDLPNVRVLLK